MDENLYISIEVLSGLDEIVICVSLLHREELFKISRAGNPQVTVRSNKT
jgi:hypothetical protein